MQGDEGDDGYMGDLSQFLPPDEVASLQAKEKESEIIGYKRKLNWKEKRKIKKEEQQKEEDEQLKRGFNSAIPSSNIGFKMLQQMGYSPGVALGKHGQGRIEPVNLEIKRSRTGLGRDHIEKEKQIQKAKEMEMIAQKRKLNEINMISEFEERKNILWQCRKIVMNYKKARFIYSSIVMSNNYSIQFATNVFQQFKNLISCNRNKKICSNGIAIAGHSSSPFLNEECFYNYTRKHFITKVRLKWVKNRGFDHVVNKETEIKAVCMLKDIIKKQPDESLPVSSVAKKQDHLGLTIPVLRFMRRYPTIFKEFVGPKYNVPWFRLTKEVSDLHKVEQRINQEQGMESVYRLCKMLMMTKSRKLPLYTLESWKWDLGLSDDYVETLIPNYPEYLSIVKMSSNSLGLKLIGWKDALAISVLQKRAEDKAGDLNYRNFKKSVPLAYEMNYPRGYGRMKKVISWMDEWQKLPYISPYEDVSNLDPESHLMEKRVVGVFHELLNLTIHKRTERNNFSPLRKEMKLPERFTRIFTRYPGIFYLSRKCAKTTLTLREAYKSAQLLEKHPLVAVREKYFYMMRMGILYRKAGTDRVNANTARFDHGSSGANEEVSDGSHNQGLSDGRAPMDIHDFNCGTFVDNDYSEDDDKEF